MRRSIWILSLTIAVLLAPVAMSGRKSAKAPSSLQCSLTGQKIDSCCCQTQNGKTTCTLTKKVIDSCCCVSSNDTAAKKKATTSKQS